MSPLSLVNSSVLALHFILEKNASITIIHVMRPTIHAETMLLVWPRLMGSRYASVKKVTYENAACLVLFTIVHSKVNYSETLSVKFKPISLWMVKEEHPLQQLNNIAKLWPILGHSLELEKGMIEDKRGTLQTVYLGFFLGTGQIISQSKSFPTIWTIWQWNQQPREVIDFYSLQRFKQGPSINLCGYFNLDSYS